MVLSGELCRPTSWHFATYTETIGWGVSCKMPTSWSITHQETDYCLLLFCHDLNWPFTVEFMLKSIKIIDMMHHHIYCWLQLWRVVQLTTLSKKAWRVDSDQQCGLRLMTMVVSGRIGNSHRYIILSSYA